MAHNPTIPAPTTASPELVAGTQDHAPQKPYDPCLALARTVELWVSKGIIKTLPPYENNENGLLHMARLAITQATL